MGPSVFRCFFQSQYGRVLGGVKGGYRHTARGTKPAEVAAGGAVMAVRVPGFSPFTVLLQKNRVTLKQEIMKMLEPRSHVAYTNT